MNPGQHLQEQGYQLDAELHHNELIPFVVTHLLRKNAVTIFFLILNIIFVIVWLVLCGWYLWTDALSFIGLLKWSAFGALVIIPLIPVHEVLHGITYKLCGATKVSYKANWRKMYFMAVADGFITGRKAFFFIGLTPFIVISVGAMLAAYFTGPGYRIMWLTMLWLHSTMCAGDFGLLSYFRENRHREIVTYDDTEKEISSFWSRSVQS